MSQGSGPIRTFSRDVVSQVFPEKCQVRFQGDHRLVTATVVGYDEYDWPLVSTLNAPIYPVSPWAILSRNIGDTWWENVVPLLRRAHQDTQGEPMSHTLQSYHTALENAEKSRKALVDAMVGTFPIGCRIRIRTEGQEDDTPIVVGHQRHSCELVVENEDQRTRNVPLSKVTHRKLVGEFWDSVDEETVEQQNDEPQMKAAYRQGVEDLAHALMQLRNGKRSGGPSAEFLLHVQTEAASLIKGWRP